MINVVKCVGAEQGCLEVFRTEDAVAPGARFSCKVHTGKDIKNEAEGLAFQSIAFDLELGSGTDPRSYERGQNFNYDANKNEGKVSTNRTKKDRLLKEAQELLKGGYDEKTKKEILDIVGSDLKDF